jgi:hypothetical protein
MRITPRAAGLAAATLLMSCDQRDPGGPDLATPPSFANVVLESSGPPFYSIVANGGFVPHTDEWAALPLARKLSCVPPDANLLAFAGPPSAACAVLTGREHWETAPGPGLAPRQTVFRGLGAVPIVFAPWALVQDALADDVLTLAELTGPDVRLGYARVYHETDILGVSGPLGAGRGMYKISAHGDMVDGGSFRLLVNEVLGELQTVEIEFTP